MAEPTTNQRKMFARMGIAMPDGSYYIRNAKELSDAIDAVGRGSGNHDDIRKHIISRAKALHLDAKIPANWNPDGSMKQSDPVSEFLAHYGVKGMQWDHHVAQPNAPFIQRGGRQQAPQFTPQQRADKLAQLMQLIKASQTKATDQSAQEAKDNPSPAADAAHQANVAHLAAMSKAAADVQATNQAHKAANSAKPANHPANAANAANLKNKVSAAAAAHKAHVAKNGKKTAAKAKGAAHNPAAKKGTHHPAAHKPAAKPSVKSLSVKDKAALAKLSPAQRHSLAVLTPAQRKTLASMSEADKKALSGLSQKQKDALAKATAASATKRHKEALARKAAASVQHSNPAVDEFLAQFGVKMAVDSDSLEHHGVKGMHWGVRKVQQAYGFGPDAFKTKSKTASRRTAKADRAFEYVSTKNLIAINNKAADAMNNHEIPRINAKPQYKNADFTHDSPLRRKYYADYASTLEKHLNLAADELGTNASGTRKYSVKVDPVDLGWHVQTVDVKHAENSSFTIKPKLNAKGLIVSFEKMTDEDLTQMDPVDEFLSHHGIKGMHWGVRRNGGHPGEYKAKVPVSSSPDHQQSALIKSKVKAHGGIHALSNDELETVNKRLNLEQNYHRLTAQPGNADKGRSFVKKAITDAKTGIDLYNTLNQVGKIGTDIHSETKKRQARQTHQSRRTRNAPLRVVSIK